MNGVDLLPCPLCGYALTNDEGLCIVPDVDEFGDEFEDGRKRLSGVCCPGCAVFLPLNNPSIPEAIAAWNRRALPSTAGEPVRDGSWQDLQTTLRPRVVARWGKSGLAEDEDEEGWVDSNGLWVLEEGEQVIGLACPATAGEPVATADGLSELSAIGAHGHLERTSPKGPGQKFIGRCVKCGAEGLTADQVNEPCLLPELYELEIHAHTARGLLDRNEWTPSRLLWSRLVNHLDTAISVITRQSAAAPPAAANPSVTEGWMMVPAEATSGMISAGNAEWNRLKAASLTLIYRAMLKAAPQPPLPPSPITGRDELIERFDFAVEALSMIEDGEGDAGEIARQTLIALDGTSPYSASVAANLKAPRS